jgi:hypothetical protein
MNVMNLINLKIVIGFLAITAASLASATEFEIPNEFQNGEVTSASDMNANFLAIKAELIELKAELAELDALKAQLEASQESEKVVFEGFTEASFTGDVGLFAMQQACHNLVPESNICTEKQLLDSHHNPAAVNLAGSAWILSGRNYVDGVTFSTFGMNVETTSAYDGYSMLSNCSGMMSSNGTGSAITDSGGFFQSACSYTNKVACCK